MANHERNPVITIQPTPNYTPTARRPVNRVQLTLHPRTMHARELIRRTGDNSIEVKTPEVCPMCKSQDGCVSEILKDGQWWWSCRECGNEWDPVRRTI